MAKDTEIEIQVQVAKITPLLQFLAKKAKLIGKVHQIDQYFTPAHRNFLAVRPADEWLRLRTSSGKHSITYKFWHHDKKTGQSNWADEYEAEVSTIGPLEKIFKALNFKPIVTVDKKRDIWLYGDYEIAIDRVKGLGNFIELEYKQSLAANAAKGKNAKVNPDKIASQMVQFLKMVGCGKITLNYQGYPFLLLFPKEAKYERV